MYLKQTGLIITYDNNQENQPLGFIDIISFNVSVSLDEMGKKAEVVIGRFRKVDKYITEYIELPGSEPEPFIARISGYFENKFIRGQKIGILISYEQLKSNENRKSYLDKFWITRISVRENEIVLSLEDNMFKLKSADKLVNIQYLTPQKGGKGGEKDLIKFVADGIKRDWGYDVKILPENIKREVDEYIFDNMTWAEVLVKLRDENIIRSFFVGDTLIIGLPYIQSGLELSEGKRIIYGEYKPQTLEVSFIYNKDESPVKLPIIENNLEYFSQKDMTIKVNGKNITKNEKGRTKTENYEVIRPRDGGEIDREIDQVFYNLSSDDFKKSVEEVADSLNLSGFNGDFTLFGALPEGFYESRYVELTDWVKIYNVEYGEVGLSGFKGGPIYEDYNEGEDIYMVVGYNISYSSGGIRQNIIIDGRIEK
jgi:hypothetical protein